jgi:hypothetical protein
VVCDFRNVSLRQVGPDRVEVRGAAGRAPTGTYKVSATYQDGFRSTGMMMIGGVDAVRKAERVAEALLRRTRRIFSGNFGDYRRTDVEVLGAEANYGPHSRARGAREVILKLAVHHDERAALEVFSREFLPSASSMAQGITGFATGRPSVTPLVRLFSFCVPKEAVEIVVEMNNARLPFRAAAAGTGSGAAPASDAEVRPVMKVADPKVTVPLIALAYGRSGDKGDDANIGVLARRPEFVPLLRSALTANAVKAYFAYFVQGDVERFDIPGLLGFNFLMRRALSGGGTASLRHDPQGKMLAQILMDFPVEVPAEWLARRWVELTGTRQ